jgi:Zn-dependent peptidase ImmA (M78 family)
MLRREIQRIIQLRGAALDLYEPEQTLPFRAPLEDDPESLAARLRALLNISQASQDTWTDSYAALRAWRNAVEAQGVLVVQSSGVPLEEMRGVSLGEQPLPIIALNAKDWPNPRIFTLLHELVHIALHEGGVCEWSPTTGLPEVEVFCNHVAGAILVPAEVIAEDPLMRGHGKREEWTDQELGALARRFSTSKEVILRRLLVIRRTSQAFYRQKRDEFVSSERPSPGSAVVSYPRHVVSKLGKAYIEIVLGSYYQRKISLAEAAEYLGVKVSHIPAIEEEATGLSFIHVA